MTTRRDFIKRASYAAPTILTLQAAPALAGTGSGRPGSHGGRKREQFDRYRKHERFWNRAFWRRRYSRYIVRRK